MASLLSGEWARAFGVRVARTPASLKVTGSFLKHRRAARVDKRWPVGNNMKLLSLNTGGVHAYHRSDYAMCWNKGQLLGQKPTLKLKEIWAIRIRLQLDHRNRELALFNLAIDSKLRGCDLVGLRVHDVVPGSHVAARAIVMQRKTQRPVQF